MREKDTITYEIEKQLGVISSGTSGWNKELNLVAWNNGPAKFDIRDWDPFHERMRKGTTLTMEEGYTLYQLLKEYFDENEVK